MCKYEAQGQRDLNQKTMVSNFYLWSFRLSSAYDPDMYTSWKFRGDHECKETLDYIFASQDRFRVEGVLESASEAEIGINLLPSLSFASDHLSLVADLKVIIDVENEMTDFVWIANYSNSCNFYREEPDSKFFETPP